MPHRITLIPGDGIGPEVTEAVVRILKTAGVDIEWERHDAGVTAFKRFGVSLPAELLDSIIRNKTALKGPVTTPIGEGFTSVNVGLRKALDLYANLRPVSNLAGVTSRFTGVDLVIVRENTEDLYSGLEHEVVPGVVESLKIITARASTRIARFAFEYARRHGRKRVTAIHKANIMKLGDGLFLESVRTVAREYGDIVSDLCAGLVGGLGIVPGANHGTDMAVFEAVHGSAPDIAGKNLANPTALLLSAVMMLRHLGEGPAAERILGALGDVLVAGRVRTHDLGGTATTTEFTQEVCRALDHAGARV